MKGAFWGYWLIILGVFVVFVMLLVQNVTTGTAQTDALIREVAESAMLDAVNYSYYRTYGEVKIDKEKFEENFIRRFADSVDANKAYNIEFNEVYEAPPKVSVKVSSSTDSFNVAGDVASFDLVDTIDAILEFGNEGE